MTKIHLPLTRWIRRIEPEIEDGIGKSILIPLFNDFHDFEMLTTDIIDEQLYIQLGLLL